ncbi:hypothetical protein PHPALM_28298 [Phytophthora palmivora]|uniref:Uncharacterized protein n=1 Tax=Phytophthora palmivora TaxID=4796 RepID=A0A2P4XAF2_9STRA|nr:hypothetical protein PHPALM_28298 [Phytophthora palmivora]
MADDLYEAQTLMAISQYRSEARRRDDASPQRRSVGGSGGSNSDAGSGDQDNGPGPTGGSGPANPPPWTPTSPDRFRFSGPVPLGPLYTWSADCAGDDVNPWMESRLANQTFITMSVNILSPILPFRPDWIFPNRPTIFTSPAAPAFFGPLITEANFKALQAFEPCHVMRNTLPPITFEPYVGCRLGIFIRQYRDFEATELIAV